MVKVRVIPTMLWKGAGLVKGVGFNSWRRVGSILPAMKVYNAREVDELVLLDIAATSDNREPDYEVVAEVSTECFVPLTVGGGINKLEQIRKLLLAGADKVCINTAAYNRPSLVREAADCFGSQCIVVGIDYRRSSKTNFECFSHNGSVATGIQPHEWAKRVEMLGAGEILLTSIERDGTMIGYDLEGIRLTADQVSIPVIASGGAGQFRDMYDAIVCGKASAVAAASIYHFTEQTPLQAKRYLAQQGIRVRNANAGA